MSYTQILVEITDVYLILGLFVPVFIGLMWQLNRINPSKIHQKKASGAAESSVSELFAVQTEQIKEIIKSKNNQIKSFQQQLRQDQDENQPESNEKQVSFEEITALVKQTYPKYTVMLPVFKKQIMEITKGMSLQQVLEYVKQFTGNQQPEATSDPQSVEYNPNWA